MRCLVIGYGSAGQRHARILKELGHEVAAVSNHHQDAYRSIRAALCSELREYVVIASATKEHFSDLQDLRTAPFLGPVLLEKPAFIAPLRFAGSTWNTSVGYNLRFHPAVRALRDRIAGRELYTVQFHVGQWLPTWRPDRNYRETDVNGVLRDLSHELDLMLWLCGWPKTLRALSGKATGLDIDSEDYAQIICETERCPAVSVTMNYIDQWPRRWIHVNYDGGTIMADLVGNMLIETPLNGTTTTTQYHVDKDDTYRAMHQAMIDGTDAELLCSLDEGLQVVSLIALVESCAKMPWERAA